MLRYLQDLELILVELCVDLMLLQRLLLDNLNGAGHTRTAMLADFDHAVIALTDLL